MCTHVNVSVDVNVSVSECERDGGGALERRWQCIGKWMVGACVCDCCVCLR